MRTEIKYTAFFTLSVAVIPHVWGHEDREGFCSSVLPAYPKDGIDIGQFLLCECEESHSTSGQAIVICQYTHVGKINDAASSTGSCDAKICLFTQECTVPIDFQPSELDARAFDLSVFDQWCVDKAASSPRVEETFSPTLSPEPVPDPDPDPVPDPDPDPVPVPVPDPVEKVISNSSRIDYILSLQILAGATIISGLF